MTTTRGGRYPVISDYEDSFIRMGNGRDLQRRSKRTKKPQPPPTSVVDLTDDNDLSAPAEHEEELRDQEAQNERAHSHHQPASEPNPIMMDGVTRTHKYKVGKSILQPTEKPLWTSIRAINKELKKFADKNERVLFFDATELFATKLSSNKYQLLTDRISDRGHPTEEGFRIWEDEIVKKLEQIIYIMKQDYPELFKPVPIWYGGSDTSNNDATNDKTALNVVDDEVAKVSNDDFDENMLSTTDDFSTKRNNGDEAEDKNILVDPDESNNDDDAIDGDLIVSPPAKRGTNSYNNDDGDANDDRP